MRTLLLVSGVVQCKIGLYRIYFFPIRPELDFAGFGMTDPDFEIDCNFTNLMCKTL